MSFTLSLGLVSSAQPGSLSVQADSQYLSIPSLAPWGIASLPPDASQAAVLSDGLTDLCLGSPQQPVELLPGEVRLSSSGGAYVLLRQNGDVVINGHSFPKEVV